MVYVNVMVIFTWLYVCKLCSHLTKIQSTCCSIDIKGEWQESSLVPVSIFHAGVPSSFMLALLSTLLLIWQILTTSISFVPEEVGVGEATQCGGSMGFFQPNLSLHHADLPSHG